MDRRSHRGVFVLAVAAALVCTESCASDHSPTAHEVVLGATPPTVSASAVALHESTEAQARVEEVRTRFVTTPVVSRRAIKGLAQDDPTPRPVLAGAVATTFEVREGYARAVIPVQTKLGLAKTASVALPMRANDPVRLADDTSRVAVTFALRGTTNTAMTIANGIALYAGALAGADVMHRVHSEGTEDYVVFELKPDREEIAYDVDVSRVAGLRLVSNTLEFLDEGGTPRLRVAPP
jgi:hypothetical protein